MEERVALAQKLYKQAVASGHQSMAETWSQKADEFEREMKIIRESIRRMDQLAA
jgi:two-component system chemotaxis response regulator CheB